ncbi:MAG: ABC transporter ATP-binding protein [Sulfuricella sp.]|nr:ABC transporter ATP-binding protein [Sulfuricella sp.]
MPSDDIAISVKNLTKKYRIFGHPGDRIKQALTFGRVRFHREFTALQDVSFEINKGETVGIIGRNGSGKSTLLQLICGILKPTSGTVQVNGRVSALLELGAGFNPEFTGRENVYFQGALMGFTKVQMDERFDDVAAFADIGEFIDQPVRTYSSGMYVRLAFAANVHVNADILVVDEALSVGDAGFQRKALRKMQFFVENGGTLIYVSHDLESVRRTCTHAILLQHGRQVGVGDTKSVCDAYEQMMFGGLRKEPQEHSSIVIAENTTVCEISYGGGDAHIECCWILNSHGEVANKILYGEPFSWNYRVRFNKAMESPIFGMLLKTVDGWSIYGIERKSVAPAPLRFEAGDEVNVKFSLVNNLMPGTYYLNCGIRDSCGGELHFLHRRVDSAVLEIRSEVRGIGFGVANLVGNVEFQMSHEPITIRDEDKVS